MFCSHLISGTWRFGFILFSSCFFRYRFGFILCSYFFCARGLDSYYFHIFFIFVFRQRFAVISISYFVHIFFHIFFVFVSYVFILFSYFVHISLETFACFSILILQNRSERPTWFGTCQGLRSLKAYLVWNMSGVGISESLPGLEHVRGWDCW